MTTPKAATPWLPTDESATALADGLSHSATTAGNTEATWTTDDARRGRAGANDLSGAVALPRMRGALSTTSMVATLLVPTVVTAWLIAMAISLGTAADGKWPAAMVLVLACTYPGQVVIGERFWRLAVKSTVTTAAIAAGLYVLALASGWSDISDRSDLLAWFVALPAGLIGSQYLAHLIVPRVVRAITPAPKVVICGGNAVGIRLAMQLRSESHGVQFLGYFDDRAKGRIAGDSSAALLGSFSDLGDYVRMHAVDRIYLALPMAAQPRILKLLEDLQDSTASIFFVPDIYVTDIINGRLSSIDGIPVLSVRDTPFAGADSFMKRAFDVLLAGGGLIFGAPVFAAIAIGIKLTSPGPVLFKQRRYGIDGREILVYKFRTMSVTEDGAKVFTAAVKNDPRITRFGQILRKTSLDELPQLFNVVQGRMSLVGPRPHAVAMNEAFRKVIRGYMIRHKVKPGLTGLAQVRGFRGGDDLESMRKRIDSDIEYLRHWSVALDAWIVLRTAFMVLFDRKAF